MTIKDKEIEYLNLHKEKILTSWEAGVTAKALSQEHSVKQSTIKTVVKEWLASEESQPAAPAQAPDNENRQPDHETPPEDHGTEAPEHEKTGADHGPVLKDTPPAPESDPEDEAFRLKVKEAEAVFNNEVAEAREAFNEEILNLQSQFDMDKEGASSRYDGAYAKAYKKYMKAIGSNP